MMDQRSRLDHVGKAIWDGYGAGSLDPGARALVLEFARCADTLDRLDGLAAAKHESWAILTFDDMGEIHLSVDKILDERRQHQIALKQLFGEMRMCGIKPLQAGLPVEAAAAQPGSPQAVVDELRARRENREQQYG